MSLCWGKKITIQSVFPRDRDCPMELKGHQVLKGWLNESICGWFHGEVGRFIPHLVKWLNVFDCKQWYQRGGGENGWSQSRPSFLQNCGVWRHGLHSLSSNISEPHGFVYCGEAPGFMSQLSYLECGVGNPPYINLSREMKNCENVEKNWIQSLTCIHWSLNVSCPCHPDHPFQHSLKDRRL